MYGRRGCKGWVSSTETMRMNSNFLVHHHLHLLSMNDKSELIDERLLILLGKLLIIKRGLNMDHLYSSLKKVGLIFTRDADQGKEVFILLEAREKGS